MIKFFIAVVFLLFYSVSVTAAESVIGGYFQPLWDFIGWIHDLYLDLKNSILAFFIEMAIMVFYYWLKLKIESVTFIWSVVEPIITSLNLTDVVSQAFGNLRGDWQAFISQIRLGEGINILVSAKLTRMILGFIGW